MPSKIQEKKLFIKRWQGLTLCEQLGNIWSEVGRAVRWENKDDQIFRGAVSRAINLFDCTLSDSRHSQECLRKINRLKKDFCNAVSGGQKHDYSLKDIEHYLFPYALIARQKIEGP